MRWWLLHNWALRWIYLHEEHVREQLNAVNPFLGGIAASSPFGDFGEGEIESCGTHSRGRIPAESLLAFRDRAEFIRCRLTMLLKTIEVYSRLPATQSHDVLNVLPELCVLYSHFRSLRNSPPAWQSIHTEDTQLLSRAETALAKHGLCSGSQ